MVSDGRDEAVSTSRVTVRADGFHGHNLVEVGTTQTHGEMVPRVLWWGLPAKQVSNCSMRSDDSTSSLTSVSGRHAASAACGSAIVLMAVGSTSPE